MLTEIIMIIGAALICAVIYVIYAGRKAEQRKYYDAAYKVIKEECLNSAIKSRSEKQKNGQKQMLCLRWKDGGKQGYVFDPEKPVWIGRDPKDTDICIKDGTVSSRHCVLYLYQGTVFLKDLDSRNGTRIKQGLAARQVRGVSPVYSGDKIIVGDMTIKVTIFQFDMAYI